MTAAHLDSSTSVTPAGSGVGVGIGIGTGTGRDTGPMTVDVAAAQPLWDRLLRARVDSQIVSVAEDAVFRFYLPLARALADRAAVNPDRAEQAAELGLAKAVLAWRHPDCTEFSAFARSAILHQIQQIPARTPRRRRTFLEAQRQGR